MRFVGATISIVGLALAAYCLGKGVGTPAVQGAAVAVHALILLSMAQERG